MNTNTSTHPVHLAVPLAWVDRISALALKLDALLMATYGESGESFRCLNSGTQDAYLWTCSDLARELRDAISSREVRP